MVTSQIKRRNVIGGLSTLPLAMVLADSVLAKKRASLLQTVQMKTEALGKSVTASIAMPASLSEKSPCVLLIHEWYGLNDQIRSVAADFADRGYIALAADLYDRRIGFTREECSALMGAVKSDEAQDTLTSWINWLRDHEYGNGRVGTVGWCFGGGWSLKASMATPVDATVVYYGDVTAKAAALKSLKGPVLGHFGRKDDYINPAMVAGFEAQMKEADKTVTAHMYDADHAFANPTKGAYHDKNAALAWDRTNLFFSKHLREA